MSDFGSKLKEAISNVENDIANYEWLYFDDNGNKKTIKLIDATDDQLNQFKVHCDVMLKNEDENRPGRFIVMKKLEELDNKLGSEIFMRTQIGDLTKGEIVGKIIDSGCKMTNTAEEIFSEVESEYKNIPVESLVQSGREQAGVPYFKQFTKALFYKAGVWVGREELRDLQRKYQQMKTIPAIREELQLPSNVMIGISPETGLSLKDMKLALSLRGNNTRFHEFETDELISIRTKLLPVVVGVIRDHIDQWTTRKRRIQEVIIDRMPSIED